LRQFYAAGCVICHDAAAPPIEFFLNTMVSPQVSRESIPEDLSQRRKGKEMVSDLSALAPLREDSSFVSFVFAFVVNILLHAVQPRAVVPEDLLA
jgi:hypothetical protein